MPVPVSLVRCPSYEREAVRLALAQALAPLGGMRAFISPGQRVLLKPNLLSPKPPEAAVTTHPEVVRAVAEAAQEAGGKVFLGDSTTLATLEATLEKTGVGAVMRELGVETAPMRTPAEVPVKGPGVFKVLDLAGEVFTYDRVINLPKLKSHGQMTLTLGVKNLFGCVVGMAKPAWHLRAGNDPRFADLLLDVARTVAPCLTVMDGIVGMEGNGPGSGTPRHLGLLAASPDPLAMDFALAEALGVPERKVPILYRARARGLAPAETVFPILAPGEVAVRGFLLPPTGTDINWRLPELLRKPLRRNLSTFPAVEAERCNLCGKCVEVCPAKTIRRREKRIEVDRSLCIGCFCCQEMCPQGAITPVPGRLLALLRRVGLA